MLSLVHIKRHHLTLEIHLLRVKVHLNSPAHGVLPLDLALAEPLGLALLDGHQALLARVVLDQVLAALLVKGLDLAVEVLLELEEPDGDPPAHGVLALDVALLPADELSVHGELLHAPGSVAALKVGHVLVPGAEQSRDCAKGLGLSAEPQLGVLKDATLLAHGLRLEGSSPRARYDHHGVLFFNALLEGFQKSRVFLQGLTAGSQTLKTPRDPQSRCLDLPDEWNVHAVLDVFGVIILPKTHVNNHGGTTVSELVCIQHLDRRHLGSDERGVDGGPRVGICLLLFLDLFLDAGAHHGQLLRSPGRKAALKVLHIRQSRLDQIVRGAEGQRVATKSALGVHVRVLPLLLATENGLDRAARGAANDDRLVRPNCRLHVIHEGIVLHGRVWT
mmetsp:Transcript_4857/g.17062  ORF Transcript_4857/g.17062 Transcript_4857/m.17062 type:complete len:390 (-) Transcript_4857:696-1865(-)